jgi:hypothetical protein
MKRQQHALAAYWRLITHDLKPDRSQVESFPSLRKPSEVLFTCEVIRRASPVKSPPHEAGDLTGGTS